MKFVLLFLLSAILNIANTQSAIGGSNETEIADTTPQSEQEYDFIVVGAGSAGSAVAARLSEIENATVLVIEAGRSAPSYLVLPFQPQIFVHPMDYDVWAGMGNTGWSYDEVQLYFKKLEEVGIRESGRNVTDQNTGGPLYVSDPNNHTALAKAFLEAGLELGYPAIDFNGRNRIGYSFVRNVSENGEGWNANRAYLKLSSGRPNLSLSNNSFVDKVLIDPVSKLATGVEFTKNETKIRVKARKEIILSAGATGTPKILMLSGVGPSDHLKQMNISVIQDAPIGKNLMDHLVFTGLVFLVDDNSNRTDGPNVTSGTTEALAFINTKQPGNLTAYPDIKLLFASGSRVSDYFFLYTSNISSEYWESFSTVAGNYSWTIFPMITHPGSRSEVLLRDADSKSSTRTIANYFGDPEDLKTMVRGIRAAIAVSKTRAMQRFGSKLFEALIPRCENYAHDSDDYWECAARGFSNPLYHQSGTCKMAPENDTTGVVNPRLQVKGIKGLRVADASIMPTIPTDHINVATIMIGEKLADMVKEDWGYKPQILRK